jgi:chemotaxis protein MotB
MELLKKQADEGGGEWLTTFGDMITLLFTFFVLVYSFCSYSPGEWETASRSIKRVVAPIQGTKGNSVVPGGGTGSLKGHMGVVPLFSDPSAIQEARRRTIGKHVTELKKQMADLEGIDIEQTETGVTFRVATPVLFDRASAEAKPAAEPFLQAIGRIAQDTGAAVIVTGHTCDLPISTLDYESNWELSARRATNVLRQIELHAGDDVKLIALARGQFDPLVANENEECRSHNRRVEIRLDVKGDLPFES